MYKIFCQNIDHKFLSKNWKRGTLDHSAKAANSRFIWTHEAVSHGCYELQITFPQSQLSDVWSKSLYTKEEKVWLMGFRFVARKHSCITGMYGQHTALSVSQLVVSPMHSQAEDSQLLAYIVLLNTRLRNLWRWSLSNVNQFWNFFHHWKLERVFNF